jgi:hypothetical protein
LRAEVERTGAENASTRIHLGVKLCREPLSVKKAAEANLSVRREETAAMGSQANTAELLEGNPTLMRLKELEVLERVAGSGKLNVVLADKGLAERIDLMKFDARRSDARPLSGDFYYFAQSSSRQEK